MTTGQRNAKKTIKNKSFGKVWQNFCYLYTLKMYKLCKTAFGKVIEHYSSQLYWQIRRMVIDHDDANDVLQNTFLKAWTSIDNFRGDAKLSTWLYKIAINESITFVNKKKVMNQLSIDDDESFLVNQLESDEWFDGDRNEV